MLMLKKIIGYIIILLLIALSYIYFLYNSAQKIVSNSLNVMYKISSLSYSGSFTYDVNKQRQNYLYNYTGQVKEHDLVLVKINRQIKNDNIYYQLLLSNKDKILIKNDNSWQPLAPDQKNYYINPYTPFQLEDILHYIKYYLSLPFPKGTTKINNQQVKIIKGQFDKSKLTSLFKNNPKNKKEAGHYYNNVNPSGNFVLYINPKTKYLHRLEITLNIKIKDKLYTYRNTYSFYKFS